MTASEKKKRLDAANSALNKKLNSRAMPKDVFEFSKWHIYNNDRMGWFWDGEKKGTYNFYCCACQTRNEIKFKPRHMGYMNCPKCLQNVNIRKHGRSKDYREWNKHNFCFVENHGGVIVARFYNNDRYYRDTSYHFDIRKQCHEYQRIIFRPEGVRRFTRQMWYHSGRISDWYGSTMGEAVSTYAMVQLPVQLREVFAGSYLEKSPWLDGSCNWIYALYKFATWPTLEYLAKLGYDSLVKEIIDGRSAEDKTLSLHKRKTNEVLGVPHSILQKYNHSTIKESGIKVIKQLIEFGRLGQLTQERFDFLASITSRKNSLGCLEIFRHFGLEKVFNYLDKQKTIYEKTASENEGCGHGYSRTFDRKMMWGDFQDYYGECHELGYDLTDEGIIFSKNMHSAHQRTSQLVEAQRDRIRKKQDKAKTAEENKQYVAKVKKFLEKSFGDQSGLIIRIAKSPKEIRDEGKILKHCVGGYVTRVVQGGCFIYVVRAVEKPDKPLYTIELNSKTNQVVQCRGFGNTSVFGEPKVRKLIEGWLATLSKKAA